MAVATTPIIATNDAVAPGSGPTRKPGNLWTVEAREDMYNRRESGEGWETICQDYPNRSRHAMQQQYSMMKKQRALENGTWTINRRGRKRRMISPDVMRDDGEMSDEDLSDGSAHRSRTMRLPPFSHIVGRGQPSFLRSATGPLFPRHLPAIGSSSDASGSPSPIPLTSSPDFKRPKLVEDRSESGRLYPSHDPWHPKLPELAFTEADIAALVQKGRDQAAYIVEDMNQRKEAMRKSKDDQISRYITQLRDAQDRLAVEKGQGPYAQELNRRDKDIESLRSHVALLQETLISRDTRIIHIGNENAEIRSRLVEIEKRKDNPTILGANSPPTTPVEFQRTSDKPAPWEEAITQLSTRIDTASNCVKTIRAGLDKASIGQIFQNIDELDLVLSLVVKERDQAMSTLGKMQRNEEALKQ